VKQQSETNNKVKQRNCECVKRLSVSLWYGQKWYGQKMQGENIVGNITTNSYVCKLH
jgi:hypothetical protein